MATLEELEALYKAEEDLAERHTGVLHDINTVFSQVYPIGSKATCLGHHVTITSKATYDADNYSLVRIRYGSGIVDMERVENIKPLDTTS